MEQLLIDDLRHLGRAISRCAFLREAVVYGAARAGRLGRYLPPARDRSLPGRHDADPSPHGWAAPYRGFPAELAGPVGHQVA